MPFKDELALGRWYCHWVQHKRHTRPSLSQSEATGPVSAGTLPQRSQPYPFLQVEWHIAPTVPHCAAAAILLNMWGALGFLSTTTCMLLLDGHSWHSEPDVHKCSHSRYFTIILKNPKNKQQHQQQQSPKLIQQWKVELQNKVEMLQCSYAGYNHLANKDYNKTIFCKVIIFHVNFFHRHQHISIILRYTNSHLYEVWDHCSSLIWWLKKFF